MLRAVLFYLSQIIASYLLFIRGQTYRWRHLHFCDSFDEQVDLVVYNIDRTLHALWLVETLFLSE